MSENETGQTDLGGDILGVAKKVASAGDRWFVSFARGLGRAAGRLRKETNIVTSSAKSAAATTGRVTAKMVSRMKPRLVSSTPAPEKTGGGTAFDLLATVAAHYALDLSALRSNTEAVETIERLHQLCAPSEKQPVEAADAAPAAAPVAEASAPSPSDTPDNIAASPPPVAEEASVGDTIPTAPVVDEAQEAPENGSESEAETVARRSRKRRGPSKS
jgi:hypothetical protein